MKKKLTKFITILCILTLIVFAKSVPFSDDPGPHRIASVKASIHLFF